eukprot:1573183-Pyramimonas_sp.AAC.1
MDPGNADFFFVPVYGRGELALRGGDVCVTPPGGIGACGGDIYVTPPGGIGAHEGDILCHTTGWDRRSRR